MMSERFLLELLDGFHGDDEKQTSESAGGLRRKLTQGEESDK
jgi:hypothetical protein